VRSKLESALCCRDAVILMGTPVFSSAASTVATALPLWLTATVALNQFGVIIAISLSVSFFYALLMLIPLLATLGPERRHGDQGEHTSWWRALLSVCLNRAAIVSGASLLMMVGPSC
jgi:multidrug efflux pump subunit AcrB